MGNPGGEAGGPTGEPVMVAAQDTTSSGSRFYATLAEVGYLVLVVYTLFLGALLAVSGDPIVVTGLPATAVSAAVGIELAAAWYLLGRRFKVSWFLAAGVFGGASAIVTLVTSLAQSPSTLESGILFNLGQGFVSLVFFAAQLLSFYTASKVFRIPLFKYATYLLAINFVATPFLSTFLVAYGVASLYYWFGFCFSGAAALVATVSFDRLRRTRSQS